MSINVCLTCKKRLNSHKNVCKYTPTSVAQLIRQAQRDRKVARSNPGSGPGFRDWNAYTVAPLVAKQLQSM